MSNSIITWNGAIPMEDIPYTIEFDAFGIGSSTLYFQFRWGDPQTAAGKIANMVTHPDFPWLKRTKARITREEADYAKAQVTFDGIPPNTDERHYSLKASLSTEDIRTHPEFQKWVEEGLVQIIDEKEFVWSDEFTSSVLSGEDRMGGIESWLVPNLIYEEVWVRGASGSSKDFSKLGKKDTPPPSDAKPGNIGGGRDFLFIGGDIELIGFGSKMTRRWRLSGPNGWNKRVYT